MGTHTGNVITLANSIIGVSVLAMPFCFKQCGIVLSILMLLFSNIITRLACHYLMKSAIMEKRKNFEMLAFRAFGPTGKLIVELCIIGFMLGTCVAYFVIMGDLGPAIISPILGFDHPTALRPSVLIGTAVFVVLPLGLLKNVDSLSAVCTATIAFYFCLVLKVMAEALGHLVGLDWMDKVYYWRPSGVLQCIPIFSMALFCQTQLFEIFDSLPSNPLDRMNGVVRSSLNMVTAFYISVGFFGYVAYCDQKFTGNLMMSFSPTITSEVIKIGFLLSVAVSFPLVIFPCRASIYSLCFSKGYEHAYTGSAHIPETRFQCITIVIVTASLVTGLLIPNIELVLGLVGSTIGVFICVIIPGVIFLSLTIKNNNERLVAKALVGTGLVIMILGTYANLYATEEAVSGPKLSIEDPLKGDTPPHPNVLENEKLKEVILKDLNGLSDIKRQDLKLDNKLRGVEKKPEILKETSKQIDIDKVEKTIEKVNPEVPVVIKDTKKEPPVPEEPQESKAVKVESPLPLAPIVVKEVKTVPPNVVIPVDIKKDSEVKVEGSLKKVKPVHVEPAVIQADAPKELPAVVKPDENIALKDVKEENQKANESIAIRPPEGNVQNNLEKDKLKENLIEKIKENEEAQKKLNEEGVKLLKELKDVVKNDSNSVKLFNVKTGTISNIKDSQLAKNNLGEKSVINEQPIEKNILTQKIAQGIPLPLAVNGKMPINLTVKETIKNIEVKGKDYDKNKENEVVEKQGVGRDILGGVKELREKRDLDEVLKADSVASEAPGTVSPLSLVLGQDQSPALDPKQGLVEDVLNETSHEATLSKLKTNLDNCNKNETKKISQEEVSAKQTEKKMDELIKAPSFLTDPKSVLDESPQLLAKEGDKSSIPEMPKKRDLKSLSSEDLVDGKTNHS